jgi:hypothetical protein
MVLQFASLYASVALEEALATKSQKKKSTSTKTKKGWLRWQRDSAQ